MRDPPCVFSVYKFTILRQKNKHDENFVIYIAVSLASPICLMNYREFQKSDHFKKNITMIAYYI